MGLTFGGEGADGRVDCGSPAALDNLNAGTIIAWAKLTTFTPSAAGNLVAKGLTTLRQNLIVTIAGNLDFTRGRASSNLSVTGAMANFSAAAVNAWLCFVAVWNTSGAAGAQRLLVGSLSSPPAEPSSYVGQTAGSGAVGDNSAENLYIGNNKNFNSSWPGPIATVGVYGSALGLGDILQLWRRSRRRITGVGLWQLYDTNLIPDYSGGRNAGTATNCTYAPHVPLGYPFRRRRTEPNSRRRSGMVPEAIGLQPMRGLY